MTDRVPLSESKAVEPEVAIKSNRDGQLSYMDDLEYHRVAEMFDLDYDGRKDPGVAEKLSYLTDWAKESAKTQDHLEAMAAIRQLKNRLGIQGSGKDTIKKLFEYVRLDNDRRRIEKKMELLHAI